jgi:hypothetical protein
VSFTAGQYNVADIRVVGVAGVRGIGFSRLQFSLEVAVNPTPGRAVQIDNLMCFVYAGRAQANVLPLGEAAAETSWFTTTGDHARRDMLSVLLDLTGEQLAALETLRSGGSVWFRIDTHAIIGSVDRGRERGFEQLWWEANLTSWSRVLKDLGYIDLLLLSIEIPLSDGPSEYMTAIQHIRDAHDDLIAGRYDAVVRRARLAMDAIDAVVSSDGRRNDAITIFADRERRSKMPKRLRSDLVQIAIRHYAHLGHHVDSAGSVELFSRHDAQFIVAAAAAAVWEALGESLNRNRGT